MTRKTKIITFFQRTVSNADLSHRFSGKFPSQSASEPHCVETTGRPEENAKAFFPVWHTPSHTDDLDTLNGISKTTVTIETSRYSLCTRIFTYTTSLTGFSMTNFQNDWWILQKR